MKNTSYTVDDHFTNREPEVRATYQAILRAAKELGAIKEEAKKTSIHLVRKSAFAGIATRKTALILTLKSKTDLISARIIHRQQASARRWYLEIKLASPLMVDKEVKGWLKSSYEMSG